MNRSTTQPATQARKRARAPTPNPNTNKNRARANKRKIIPVTGMAHRLYRVPIQPGDLTQWKRATIPTKGRHLDSVCHRYEREIGFSGQTRLQTLPWMSVWEQQSARSTDRGISQSYFECFVLENHSTDPYAEFLGRILSKMNSSIPNSTETLLISWVYHLRDDATDTLHATDAGADSTDAAALHTSASATPLAGRSLKWATILKNKRQISGSINNKYLVRLSNSAALNFLIVLGLRPLSRLLRKTEKARHQPFYPTKSLKIFGMPSGVCLLDTQNKLLFGLAFFYNLEQSDDLAT